jgi:hypothetical protein
LDFRFLTIEWIGKRTSKTKLEKTFFFIFMSSYSEMSFMSKKVKKSLNKIPTFEAYSCQKITTKKSVAPRHFS